jgi:hypothetical protein
MKFMNWMLVAIVAIAGTLTSCTVESETHFSKNYGGSQIVSVNVKDLMEMASSFGGAESGEMDDMMNKMNDPEFADTLSMMEDSISTMFAGTGAKNFSFAVSDEGIMSLGYDFESLETFERMKARTAELAQSQNEQANSNGVSDMMSSMVGGNFELNGKWLSIPLKQDNMFDDMKKNMPGDADMSDDEMEDTMAMMEGFMGGSIMFKNVYTFDRQIKKIKSDVPYVQDGNKLTVEYSLTSLMKWDKENKTGEVKVKLK